MKKTLLTFGVSMTVVCGTLAFAATGQGSSMLTESPAANVTSEEASNPNVAVSIGTVNAQLYSESGLTLNYFGNNDYVAQTSDGTYMGFSIGSGRYVIDPETGEEIYDESKYANFVAISSTEESVTIPDSIKVTEEVIPITGINSYRNLRDGFTTNIKNLTIPATIKSISCNYNFDQFLDAIYMLGAAPVTYSTLNVDAIYICNKEYFASYLNHDYYKETSLLPYGWNFEWVTVNVEKTGEFAEAYLTQNNHNWGAVQYLKVTGNINNIDLSAIKNLTAIIKLDLSETTITELPVDFMAYRESLTEVKLPTTLNTIGNSAFVGCTGLQSFDLNGITEIGSHVFSGCSSLPYINLNGVQTIGNGAFQNCGKLNNIDLTTVQYIGYEAFEGCKSLDAIDLTSAIKLGESYSYGETFKDCTSLKSVRLGNNLQYIYSRAFSNTAIDSISIPEGISSIGDEVFANCKKLTNIEIPTSVKTIDSDAFRDCSNLSNVQLPSGLVSIGTRAFHGCRSIEEITIPATVNRIDGNAFGNTGIKTFKCYAVVPPSVGASFIGDNMEMEYTYLYVPPFSKDFYRNTQYWCDFYLMRSIEDQIDYILVDRPLTINLEEEDNAVVANNPTIDLRYGDINHNSNYVGQLTATGEGTLSAGQLTITGQLSKRNNNSYGRQYIPTLINYADKMRADNVTHNLTFYNSNRAQWHFISLPYDVKVSDIIPSDNTYWVIRRYDSAARAAGETSATWVNLTNDDTLEAGKGYIVSTYNGNNAYPTLSFTSGNSVTKNNIFRSTDIIVPLTEYEAEFAHNRSWNLIGNPYPCYFDMHSLNEEFTAPVTIWNGSSYVAYSPVDDDLVLAPYEAFFVQCPLDTKEMTFKESGRMHSDDGKPLYKAATRYNELISAEDRNVFNFILSGENYEDRTRIVLNPDAQSEYEIGRDASKFFADNSDNAQIYVNADVACSINERPVNDGMATLGLRSAKETDYTLSLNGKFSDEWQVMLTDKVTGITVDLTKESYQFTSAEAEDGSRFEVKFTLNGNNQSGIDSIISDFGEDSDVTVTAIKGVVVYRGSLSDIHVPDSGIYLISNGKETRKAILK